MRRMSWMLAALMSLSSCALFKSSPRPLWAPKEEGAKFTFPLSPPEEGHVMLAGPLAKAVRLAYSDFFWTLERSRRELPPGDGVPMPCLDQEENYDALAAPYGEGVVLVSITLAEGACGGQNVPYDIGAYYAVDTKSWRILAIQQ